MNDSDGGVFVRLLLHEQRCHWLADDITSADDEDVFIGDFDAAPFHEHLDAQRSAGEEAVGLADQHLADIKWMKAVDIFIWADIMDDGCGVDMGWERELDEDPIDVGILVEEIDFMEELLFGDGVWEMAFDGMDSYRLAGLGFPSDIDFRRGVFADEDDSEGRATPWESVDLPFDLLLNLISDFFSVDNHDVIIDN